MVQITHIHLASGSSHEHISDVKWRNPDTGDTGQSSRQEMVNWLRKPDTRAYVTDGTRTVDVGIVEAHPPYIRTYADRVWTDNLLALPRF